MDEGDICWAKLNGHPWWPALICKHPVQKTHLRVVEKGDNSRHVQFFDKPPTRAWVKEKNLDIFKGSDDSNCQEGGLYFSTKKNINLAMKRGDKSLFMTQKERLKLVVERPAEEDNVRSASTETFNISETETPAAETPIPGHWKTPFVLMATNDIPEDLEPGQCVISDKQGKPVRVKTEIPNLDTESDELVDSDADPGWEPEETSTGAKKRKAAASDEEDIEDEDEDLMEDSDEDPGWAPKAKKKGLDDAIAKSKSKVVKRTKIKPKSSLPKPAKSLSSPTASSKSSPSSHKQIAVKDRAPTGPEPAIGEFLIEKAEVKDGEIPFIWRYKKGNLIQKFDKIVDDNGKVLYQNALNFSDWWACYADKYVSVKTKTMFRFRNVEKVHIVDMPEEIQELLGGSSSKASTSASPKTKKPKQKKSVAASKPSNKNENDKDQEEEVTSTTSEPDFQIGQYILDKNEERNVDNFSVWKVESNILLKKYEMVIKKGKMFHKPVKTYRGYRDISKYYLPLKVKPVHDPHEDGLIEVLEESRPKLAVDKEMEEEYDKNPLLRHFYVYMQVFLSQALEPGFLNEVISNKDETYTFPMGEIDKIVKQKMDQIERKIRWTNKMKMALQRAPYLREVCKPDDKKKCEALIDSDELVEEVAFLFGDEYDPVTLKSKGAQQSQEFKIGKTAVSHIGTYHQLCHFKFNLHEKCGSKVKLIRESKEGTEGKEPEVEDIMDSCLGNKIWVIQNFIDFNSLITA